MSPLWRLCLMVLCLGLAACGTAPRREVPVNTPVYKVGKPYSVAGKQYTPAENPTYDQTGLASWYGPKFHGRRTANGDIFNMNDLTAAHTTLPMPSHVRVTNLENGRWLILKVNDRGPFVGGRLIDVSRRAAQLLAFEQQGIARVRVQAVPDPKMTLPKQNMVQKVPAPQPVMQKPAPQIPVDSSRNIYVQIGAYADQDNARRVLAQLADMDNTARVKIENVAINGQNFYRVRVGPQPNFALAENILGRILSLGHNTARIITDD